MNDLTQVLKLGLQDLDKANKVQELDNIKSKYIGKQGAISLFMQQLKNIDLSERKEFGFKVNAIKNQFEEALNLKREQLQAQDLANKLANETIDVTLPGRGNALGSLHPVNISLNRMIEICKQFGFAVADGPEIENDYYNFKALNIPDNHPARAMQDTFYTESGNVLRTHTSPIQIRYAETHKPPIKIIAPGRVYRVDMDATHSPMFHQLEGLWIEEGISFAHLKGVIIEFLRKFFEADDLQVRFRASFFPFTEPSAEIDIMFKSSGKWLEVGGCGMVHPNVLEYMQLDYNKYQGFAFGLGIDRFTMLKYDIKDLRLMFENDLGFLKQFKA